MKYLIALLLLSCTKQEPTKEVEQPTKQVDQATVSAETPSIDVTSSCVWKEVSREYISYGKIKENSGMAFLNGVLYLHNDSGDSSRYFSGKKPYDYFDEHATSIKNTDFEAMASYKDDVAICNCGNSWNKNSIDIDYCNVHTNNCRSHVAKFPNGTKDIETFMIDPLTGNEFFIAKLYDRKNPDIWMLKNGEDTVKLIGTYKYNLVPGHIMKVFSDGAFSPSGNFFILTEIDGPLITTMVKCDFNLSSVESEIDLDLKVKNNCKTFKVKSISQIESLAFVNEGTFVYSSEGKNSPLITMSCQ